MSIIEAYLVLVARWRWSFLLALLIGSFVLQALLPETSLTRLVGFTLFMLIFGGAIYAGRTRAWAERGAVALLLLALVLQILNVLGVADLEGPLTVLALAIVLGALVATFADLVGTRDSTPDSLVGSIFGFFVIAAASALLFRQLEGVSSRVVPPPGGRGPRHANALFQLGDGDHRRLRGHHPGNFGCPNLRRARGGARHALYRSPDRSHRRATRTWFWRVGRVAD